MTEPEGPELQPYPIQLVAAFCVETSGKRQSLPEGDPPEPQFAVTLARTELDSTGTSFSCRLTVEASIPVAGLMAECRVVVQGDYASAEPIAVELLERFAGYTATVMLWPYARAYVGDIGRQLALPIPPLPTLDALPPQVDQQAEGVE
jgi:preprotein translocase subunit SecB